MKRMTAILSIVMILLTSVALAQSPATPTDIGAARTTPIASEQDTVQRPAFDNFGEALRAEPTDEAIYDDISCVTLVESSGVYYRFVAKYDNKAKKLWKEGQEEESADQIWPDQDFIDYVCKLPVKYVGVGEGIDVDLTALSSTMVYSEVYNMMTSPEDYIGKTVKMKGMYSVYHDESTDKYYFACIIKDATLRNARLLR